MTMQDEAAAKSKRAVPWKEILLAFTATALFFGLLEGVLTLAGVRPGVESQDPFVGFVSQLPTFVEEPGPTGESEMVTAVNKSTIFNHQSFSREKQPGTFRIFCLGGSTTYGRPYDDLTSFARWLRELLPVAEPGQRWEVINAGGISFASYRVAALVEELIAYEPDLLIVYTGHNEFLEERTYRAIRRTPAPIRKAVARLAGTRTWSAMSGLIHLVSRDEPVSGDHRYVLPERVDARLDDSIGPQQYERDDELRAQILHHYRVSLERIVAIARSAGVEVIFVTPASNLKDCSPFKSQHTDGLGDEDRARSKELLANALNLEESLQWAAALDLLDQAIVIDSRWAELHFRRGRALSALGHSEQALISFQTARDEDVCPLRALTAMQGILEEVAAETGSTLVDFESLTRSHLQTRYGSEIPGAEIFLDHVHPTIEGHRILAVELVETMIGLGLVDPDEGWGNDAIARVTSRVEAGLDTASHARALGNLALTLSWAGKDEDSRRLAFEAVEMGLEEPVVLMMVARHHALAGDVAQAESFLRRAIKANPRNPVAHFQIGLLLVGQEELEAAAGHFFLASVLSPDNDEVHKHLGSVMAQRGRLEVALASYLKARDLDPNSSYTQGRIDWLRQSLPADSSMEPPKLSLTSYPSGAPLRLAQAKPDAVGDYIPDGIWTEWYENGGLKRFADFGDGEPNGVDISWDPDGNLMPTPHREEG